MAKKKKPIAKVEMVFYDSGVEIQIENFEQLTPRKLEESLFFAVREWQRQQQKALYDQRRAERQAREQADAAEAE